MAASRASELKSRAKQLAILSQLGRRAIAGIDLAQLLNEAANVVAAALGVEYSSVLELLPDGKAIFQTGVGWKPGVVGHVTVEMNRGSPAGQVILTQAPVIIDDLRTDDRSPRRPYYANTAWSAA